MTSEQGNAWQERAELAERENERLNVVVRELRDGLMKIREETAFMSDADQPIASMRNAACFAHGTADYTLTKAQLNFTTEAGK